ncbi:MAG: aminoacyl-tRNA hydrolase [Planctomycetia bacterium]|nr:MAG: aminoacyl-tRNA hydrolase [Planctomycetia bacterium]
MPSPALSLDALLPYLSHEFDRGGGPGGQNVNKVSTRAVVLFDFETCPVFNEPQRDLIRRRLANRLSADGRVRVVSQSERSQSANRADAEQRLLALLTAAIHVERPRTATRPTAGSRRRRLASKQQRSETKRLRSRPGDV